jgi:hypothetical protein
MKKIITLLILLLVANCNIYAQLKVTAGGNVGIGTANPGFKLTVVGDVNAGPYQSALSTTVYNEYGCAYNLNSVFYGRDVFYICAAGYGYSSQG